MRGLKPMTPNWNLFYNTFQFLLYFDWNVNLITKNGFTVSTKSVPDVWSVHEIETFLDVSILSVYFWSKADTSIVFSRTPLLHFLRMQTNSTGSVHLACPQVSIWWGGGQQLPHALSQDTPSFSFVHFWPLLNGASICQKLKSTLFPSVIWLGLSTVFSMKHTNLTPSIIEWSKMFVKQSLVRVCTLPTKLIKWQF